MGPRVVFIDFDSYFASCEQQARPELRGKPLGVLPVMTDSTCCIAASYEAKAFGVKTGTGVREARWRCPGIQFVEAGHADYVAIHHKICEAVERCIPITEVKSIDEMYGELPPNWRTEERALSLAGEIREAVRGAVGEYIGCSIGIGPNVFLSKIASGMNKPRGLTVIRVEELPGCLHGLKLSDIHGVGRNMLRRLHAHGITTVAQLCAAGREVLRRVWGGVEGERLYAELRGEVIAREETSTRQVGHSHVLPPQLRNRGDAFGVLHRLTQKAAFRMRHKGFAATEYGVSVRLAEGGRWERVARFAPTTHSTFFLQTLRALWEAFPEGVGEPVKVSLVLGGLVRLAGLPLALFPDEGDERTRALEAAMDGLNLRYGSRTVHYAGSLRMMKEAPMRIAFGHIPDVVLEE